MVKIADDWLPVINREVKKEYYKRLYYFLKEEYEKHIIYPKSGDILNALSLTPLKKVKAVILGQDPYHEPGQAEGLSFSVPAGVPVPPSLRNIYKELNDEFGFAVPSHGSLRKWAEEGVLLLNTVLTVRAHKANSHENQGWELFTDAIIEAVNKEERPIAYLLWGRAARNKKEMLNNPKHLILESAHPSPFSAHKGFFGNGHFKKANEFLISQGESPIDWQIL